MALNLLVILLFGFIGGVFTGGNMQDGTTYDCDVTLSCVCGGGEGLLPDLYSVVIYKESKEGNQILRKQIGRSGVVNDKASQNYGQVFRFTYNPAVTQEIFFNIYDEDGFGNKDDFLGDTDWYPVSRTGFSDYLKITANDGGEMTTCPESSGITQDCAGQTGRVRFSCYNPNR